MACSNDDDDDDDDDGNDDDDDDGDERVWLPGHCWKVKEKLPPQHSMHRHTRLLKAHQVILPNKYIKNSRCTRLLLGCAPVLTALHTGLLPFPLRVQCCVDFSISDAVLNKEGHEGSPTTFTFGPPL